MLYLESGSLSKTAKLCWSKSLSSIIFELLEKFSKFKIISFANLSLPVDEYSIAAFKLLAMIESLCIDK